MDLLQSWVEEEMQTTPSECIIYCGLYDTLNSASPEHTLDNLGSLISTLKQKNGNMKINVCQVIPVPEYEEIKEKIICYNDQLLKWGASNGVKIVKTAPDFTLSTGDIDDVYFDEENKKLLILNRLGAIRLLSTIRKQCPGFKLSKNWESIKRDSRNNRQTTHRKEHDKSGPSTPRWQVPSHYLPENPASHCTLQTTTRHQYRDITPESTLPDLQHTYAEEMRRNLRRTRSGGATTRNSEQGGDDRGRSLSTQDNDEWWQGGGVNSATAFQEVERHKSATHPHPTKPHTAHRTYYSSSRHNYTRNRQGCYNCGEHNHRQSSCRFDHRLRCASCHQFGHKQRMCPYYSI